MKRNSRGFTLNSKIIFLSLQLGASASYFNSRVGSAPIHVAAQSAYVDIIKLLLKNSHNRADINIPNRHIIYMAVRP